MPAAATSGPAPMKKRGPKRSASAPKRRESANMMTVVGSVASPLLSAVKPGDLLQVDHEEEEQHREAAVHRERLQVADREVAAPEQLELQHRLRRAALVREERARARRARRRAARASSALAPAVARLLDQREDDAAEAERCRGARRCSRPACPRLRRRARHRHEDQRERGAATSGTLSAKTKRQSSWSTITPPASGPTMPATEPQASHDADRRAALLLAERRDDDRERARRQERRGGSLQRPRADQEVDRRARAPSRSRRRRRARRRRRTRAARRRCRRASRRSGSASRAPAGRRSRPTAVPRGRRRGRARSTGSATLTIVASIDATAEPRIAAASVSRWLRVIAHGGDCTRAQLWRTPIVTVPRYPVP